MLIEVIDPKHELFGKILEVIYTKGTLLICMAIGGTTTYILSIDQIRDYKGEIPE